MSVQEIISVALGQKFVGWAERFSFFAKIRRATSGYLKPVVYRELYRAAKDAPPGVFVDIGPGQGASTIVLGRVARSRRDVSRVLSFDQFRASNAMAHGDDVGLNIAKLESNLRKFGADAKVEIFLVPDSGPVLELDQNDTVSMLFVDADGALDRDFLDLYERLAPGARVVVDDFEPMINKYGVRQLSSTDPDLESYVRSKGARSLRDLTPFGKHHSTWLLVGVMLKFGFLQFDQAVGNTVFLSKPLRLKFSYSEELLRREFQLARSYIYDSFMMVRSLDLFGREAS